MRSLLPSIAALALFQSLVLGSDWLTFYENGFRVSDGRAWNSPLTRSKRTPEGLRVIDPSTEKGSGCCFHLNWNVDPEKGAEVETRVKTISCSALWGVVLVVSDGQHEEAVTFFRDRVSLCYNKDASTPFHAADEFHTYRVTFKHPDIQVFADGKRIIDGKGKFTHAAPGGRNRLSFGAASSAAMGESVWQFVRCRGARIQRIPVRKPNVPGLDVAVGETQVILSGRRYTGMFKFNDGDIVVGNRRSSDAGKTWRQATPFDTGAYQFPDGEIVQLGFRSRQTDRPGIFAIDLWRSKDNGKTKRKERAILNVPEATGGTDDQGKPVAGPVCDHAIVCLRDGSLLAACYGQFKTDKVLCEVFPPEWRFYKYRTYVVRSTDRGRTWKYWATVAYDPSVGIESFCEADLLRLPGGDILCFMRTGGARGKHTPMYMSRSSDDGRTWAKPVPIADRGVWPNACRMRNGVLVITYGRPGNWLAFSLDNGHSWIGHFCFADAATTSYNTVEEVAPDTLFVVYDRRGLSDDGEYTTEEVGTYFTVNRR